MKTRALLAAAALFTTVSVANAGEPVTLTEAEMDNVSAGVAVALAYANANAVSYTPFFGSVATYTFTESSTVSGLFYNSAYSSSTSESASF